MLFWELQFRVNEKLNRRDVTVLPGMSVLTKCVPKVCHYCYQSLWNSIAVNYHSSFSKEVAINWETKNLGCLLVCYHHFCFSDRNSKNLQPKCMKILIWEEAHSKNGQLKISYLIFPDQEGRKEARKKGRMQHVPLTILMLSVGTYCANGTSALPKKGSAGRPLCKQACWRSDTENKCYS